MGCAESTERPPEFDHDVVIATPDAPASITSARPAPTPASARTCNSAGDAEAGLLILAADGRATFHNTTQHQQPALPLAPKRSPYRDATAEDSSSVYLAENQFRSDSTRERGSLRTHLFRGMASHLRYERPDPAALTREWVRDQRRLYRSACSRGGSQGSRNGSNASRRSAPPVDMHAPAPEQAPPSARPQPVAADADETALFEFVQ